MNSMYIFVIFSGWPLCRQCEVLWQFHDIFCDGSQHSCPFAALLPMLSVTHIMLVLVLLSVVGVGMQQCMIWN